MYKFSRTFKTKEFKSALNFVFKFSDNGNVSLAEFQRNLPQVIQ